MESFSPEALIQQCIGEQSVSETTQIRVLHLCPCFGDAFLLKQVWVNMLSNSVKYSRRSNPPVIEIGSGSSEAEVIYYVKDNGVGFDVAGVPPNSVHVGLGIMRERALGIDATISVESAPGAGACVAIELPLPLSPAHASAPAAVPEPMASFAELTD